MAGGESAPGALDDDGADLGPGRLTLELRDQLLDRQQLEEDDELRGQQRIARQDQLWRAAAAPCRRPTEGARGSLPAISQVPRTEGREQP